MSYLLAYVHNRGGAGSPCESLAVKIPVSIHEVHPVASWLASCCNLIFTCTVRYISKMSLKSCRNWMQNPWRHAHVPWHGIPGYHTNNLINTEQERVSASDLDIVTKISSPSSRAHLGSLCVIDTPSSRNGDLAWKVLPDKTSKMTSHSEEGGTIVLQVLDRGDEAKMIPWQIANQWNIFLSNDSSVAFSWVPWLW